MAKINFENCLMRLQEEEERMVSEEGIVAPRDLNEQQ